VDLQSRWVEGWRIRADRFKLNQVLRNFVSNALKFCGSPRGEVEVSVERYYVAGGRLVRPPGSEGPQVVQDFVRVSVVDNGAGISQENQRRLFGQYVQFDAGALQKGGGSGLGLWISKSEWPRV
jgi:signal transduction histidine kinase